jgi:hypothetical protein
VPRLRRTAPLVGLLTATITVAFGARPAAAQSGDTDRQIAQQLFDDGRVLLEAKRYSEACPKFGESQRLDPGGGTLANLAYCHELEGKTASAWTEFRDALGQAVKDGRKDREELVRAHITDLAPKLMRVVVHVPGRLASRDPEINLDKSKLPPTAWDTAIPIDPGEHRVSVIVRGAQAWSTAISASAPGETYTVDLPTLDTAEACPEGQMRVQGVCATMPWHENERRRTTAFWLTLGGAGVLLATSAVTGIVALGQDAYVKDNCSADRDFCRVPDAADAASRAKTFAWISTVTLGAGAVATLVAFVLPREPLPKLGGRRPAISVGLGWLRVQGM